MTIGLPIYNAEATLDRAVRSIIGQGFSDWKLLLIDDGSADSSPAIAQRYRDSRIAVLSDGVNRGISARLNQAVAMTEGRYFCRMDADDIAFPDRLARQVAFLEHHPQVDLAASSIVLFRDDGTLQGVIPAPVSHGEICRSPWQGFHFFHPTWMGKTEWFRTHPYESHADGVEDQLLLYGSFRQSVFAGIPDVLLGYRENRRSFRKILYRRRLFWRKIAAQAIARGRWRDALLLSLILPLKIAADFINTELGVDQLRTRMNSVDRSVETSWHILWRNLGQPVERNSR